MTDVLVIAIALGLAGVAIGFAIPLPRRRGALGFAGHPVADCRKCGLRGDSPFSHTIEYHGWPTEVLVLTCSRCGYMYARPPVDPDPEPEPQAMPKVLR